MFGKLIKNELKTGFYSIMGIYLAAIIACGLVILTMFFDNGLSKGIGALLCLAVMIITLVALVVIIVKALSNYVKSMYGQQGYLTFTLPVKAHELYLSKMLSSFFWVLVGYLFILGSLVLSIWYISKDINSNTEQLIDMILEMVQLSSLKTVIVSVIANVVVFCVSVFSFLTIAMFSVSLGNTRAFQNHSMLWSCVFTGIIFLASILIVNKVANEYFGVYLITEANRAYFSLEEASVISTKNLSGTIFEILVIIGLSIGNVFLIKNKVNVK